ncbi:MAG: DUF2254 domain-containing protein [Alphaproteobacteria bacterium]|nr:DUF2254 domain-containing protein [Alphaproteobacteria bacterium]MCB9930117.1 DUF2254 domain-containing protein [Alphaproteobacteria bacterium]
MFSRLANLVRARVSATLGGIRWLRGFVTVPGSISLMGIALAIVTRWLDWLWVRTFPDFGLNLSAQHGELSTLLTTIAGSTMTALSLVYSSVLVVFTLAAGNIGPRLLQRFAEDRTNQVAVGLLGATFLYCVIALYSHPSDAPGQITIGVAVLLAATCVVMLLFFVNSAARKVTVDEEIGLIGDALDAELKRAIAWSNPLSRADLARPVCGDTVMTARRSGYVNRIDFRAVAALARDHEAFVDFDIVPGSYVVPGQRIALVVGPHSEPLIGHIHGLIVYGPCRTTTEDLAFSITLLVEIALRALSPGVNDTFTAVACADRLASSLLWVRRARLNLGVYTDPAGGARVTAPHATVSELIESAFTPLRRASATNMLMCRSLVDALATLGLGVGLPGEETVRRELQLVQAEFEASTALDPDKAVIRDLVERALRHEVGRKPLPAWEG